MARPATDRYQRELDQLDDINNTVGQAAVMDEWFRDSSCPSFFAIKFSIIVAQLTRWGDYVLVFQDRHPDNAALQHSAQAVRRAKDAALDKLLEWKRAKSRSLTHRERDRSRQAAPQPDYSKSCSRLVREYAELFGVAWRMYLRYDSRVVARNRRELKEQNVAAARSERREEDGRWPVESASRSRTPHDRSGPPAPQHDSSDGHVTHAPPDEVVSAVSDIEAEARWHTDVQRDVTAGPTDVT